MPYDEKKIRAIGRTCAAIVCVAGLTIIAGWQFRIGFLRGELLGTFVAPYTALLMVVSGVSILLQIAPNKYVQWLGSLLSVPVFALGCAIFLERMLGVDFGIDRLFMAHRLSDWTAIAYPGRFSTTTAINFMLTGLSLATLRVPGKRTTSDYFAAGVAMMCYFAIIGYVYETSVLYGRVTSGYTIALFVLVAVGLWCSSRTLHFARFVSSDSPGGIISRRMVVAILVLLPLLGWLEVQGRRTEIFEREVGIAFFVVVAALIFTALLLRTARVLDEIDRRRSHAEAGLIQTEKLAAAGRMAATMAHEINNPLGAVTNLIYVVRTLEMDAATRDSYLAMAEDEVRHLALISKQTLGFYRESADPTLVDCGELVQQVVALYRSRFANKGIELRQDIVGACSAWCVAGELRQVLVNLVSNAYDACPNMKGIIQVSTKCVDGQIVIDVADNGHGVKLENRERIFEPFFTTKESVGTGLGLWVSKGLMEKNSGTIEVLSEDPSFNTTFRLRLPAAESQNQSVSA